MTIFRITDLREDGVKNTTYHTESSMLSKVFHKRGDGEWLLKYSGNFQGLAANLFPKGLNLNYIICKIDVAE